MKQTEIFRDVCSNSREIPCSALTKTPVRYRRECIGGMGQKQRGFLGCIDLKRSNGSEYAWEDTYASKRAHSTTVIRQCYVTHMARFERVRQQKEG